MVYNGMDTGRHMPRHREKDSMGRAMTEQESRELWYKLRSVKNADELRDLYDADPFLSDEANWKYMGGRDNNEQVWNTQKRGGVNALSEITSNCRDALTMVECLKRGIDPQGPNAPTSTQDAIDKWFPKFDEMSTEETKDWCVRNNFIHFLGGTLADPFRVDVSDNGVGLLERDAEKRTCSLDSDEKVNCLFQTGEKSSGGTAVLKNCGEHGEAGKMITTRHFSKKDPWIWTIQRLKKVGPKGKRRKAAIYFCPGGRLPTFQAESIITLRTSSGAPVETSKRESGMIISLFDYRMGRSYVPRVWNEYVLNFTSMGLPQILMDSRLIYGDVGLRSDEYSSLGFMNRLFKGLEKFIEDQIEDKENDLVISGTLSDKKFNGVFLKAYKLPKVSEKGSNKGLSKFFVAQGQNNRVFISRRGQTNAALTKGFITRICKLPALENRIAIVVDGDKFDEDFALDYFEASRDKNGNRKDSFDKELEKAIRDLVNSTPQIKQWNKEIADEDAASAASVSIEFLSKLGDDDYIKKFFQNSYQGSGGSGQGEKVSPEPNPTPDEPPEDPDEPRRPDLKHNPTYIRAKENWKIPEGFIITRLGSRVFIPFVTDADDSFYRPANPRESNPGKFSLLDVNTGEDLIRSGKLRMVGKLHNGNFKCNIHPVADVVNVGDEISLRLAAISSGMDRRVFSEEIVKLKIYPRNSNDHVPSPPVDKKSGGLKLPNMKPVTGDGGAYRWFSEEVQSVTHVNAGIAHDWIGRIQAHGDGKSLAYINMSLFDERVAKKIQKHEIDTEKNVYAISATLALVKAHGAFDRLEDDENRDRNGVDHREFASIAMGDVFPMLSVIIPHIREMMYADKIRFGDDE